jgi:hypothetical protein
MDSLLHFWNQCLSVITREAVWFDFFFGGLTIFQILLIGAARGAKLAEDELQNERLSPPRERYRHWAHALTRMSFRFFGPRLVSWKAFRAGFILSLFAFFLALEIAIILTPRMLADIRDDFTFSGEPWPLSASIISVTISLALVLCALAFGIYICRKNTLYYLLSLSS